MQTIYKLKLNLSNYKQNCSRVSRQTLQARNRLTSTGTDMSRSPKRCLCRFSAFGLHVLGVLRATSMYKRWYRQQLLSHSSEVESDRVSRAEVSL